MQECIDIYIYKIVSRNYFAPFIILLAVCISLFGVSFKVLFSTLGSQVETESLGMIK